MGGHAHGVTMTQLGARTNIDSDATTLHAALRDFGRTSRADRLSAGERLYARVLAPLETQISGMRTLIFAPDGALHYVPFATLRMTQTGRKAFLVEKYDIAVTPSLQMLLQPELHHSNPQSPQTDVVGRRPGVRLRGSAGPQSSGAACLTVRCNRTSGWLSCAAAANTCRACRAPPGKRPQSSL